MREYIDNSLTYSQYLSLIDRLLSEDKTTGPDQSKNRVEYCRLNRSRIKRIEKTLVLEEDVRSKIAALDVDWVWLIITEGWCGDAAQNIPVIEKIASANAGIETRYILRDDNPGLMEQFLTNGARSIPKLIAMDRRSGVVLGTWGSRPKAAQVLHDEQKAAGLDKPLIAENIQRWYLADKGISLQREFADLAREWSQKVSALAA